MAILADTNEVQVLYCSQNSKNGQIKKSSDIVAMLFFRYSSIGFFINMLEYSEGIGVLHPVIFL